MQVYGLITCVRQANENARNLIFGVQFFINIYIHAAIFTLEDRQLAYQQLIFALCLYFVFVFALLLYCRKKMSLNQFCTYSYVLFRLRKQTYRYFRLSLVRPRSNVCENELQNYFHDVIPFVFWLINYVTFKNGSDSRACGKT